MGLPSRPLPARALPTWLRKRLRILMFGWQIAYSQNPYLSPCRCHPNGSYRVENRDYPHFMGKNGPSQSAGKPLPGVFQKVKLLWGSLLGARFTQFLLYKLTHSGCSSDFFAGNGHVSPFLPPSFFHTMGNSLMSVSLAAQETGQMKLYPRRRRLQLQNNGGLSLYASVHRSLITLNT